MILNCHNRLGPCTGRNVAALSGSSLIPARSRQIWSNGGISLMRRRASWGVQPCADQRRLDPFRDLDGLFVCIAG